MKPFLDLFPSRDCTRGVVEKDHFDQNLSLSLRSQKQMQPLQGLKTVAKLPLVPK